MDPRNEPLTCCILKLDRNEWLRVAGSVLPRRIEKVGESMPGQEVNPAHVLLVLRCLSHARHPHLSQLGRVLRLDVLLQVLGHLLGQLRGLLKVVGQPVRLWIEVQENAGGLRLVAVAVVRGAGGGEGLHVDHAELARPRQVVEVTGHAAVRRVVRVELWKGGI